MVGHAKVLLLGGARSGKSHFGQQLLLASPRRPKVIVTAEAGDEEMTLRIAAHQRSRPPHWETVEAPLLLADAIRREARADVVILVDCLTLWLSNQFMASHDVDQQIDRLVASIHAAEGPLVLVSNEVGTGVVPETALGRAFRDAQGCLNQAIASICSQVILMAAGQPLQIKPAPPVQISV